MKLWLVRKRDPDNRHPLWGYDCHYGHVIRADTEFDARGMAAKASGDEGNAVWLTEEDTTCTELTAEGATGIVLSDFNAG